MAEQRIDLNSGDKSSDVLNVRNEVESRRSRTATLVEVIGTTLARPRFFLWVLAAHAIWVVLNLPFVPWKPWDPYPFTFLATLASVEAPFITLLVLMHQQRESHIAELREETHLQVSLHLERELTMALRLLRETQRAAGTETHEDPEILRKMQVDLDEERLLENVRRELREAGAGEDEDDATSP
jgi:uncharacterized membrane protein